MAKIAEIIDNVVDRFRKVQSPPPEMAERMRKAAEAARKAGEAAKAAKGK